MATKPTVDLSEFFKLSRPKRKPCAVGFALTQLSDTEAVQLAAACEQDKGIITGEAVRQWLAGRKLEASSTAIANHRRGVCTCGEE